MAYVDSTAAIHFILFIINIGGRCIFGNLDASISPSHCQGTVILLANFLITPFLFGQSGPCCIIYLCLHHRSLFLWCCEYYFFYIFLVNELSLDQSILFYFLFSGWPVEMFWNVCVVFWGHAFISGTYPRDACVFV